MFCFFCFSTHFLFSSGKKENQILFRLSKRRRTIVWLRFQSQSESDTKTQNCYKKVILKKKKFLFERPTPTFSKKSFKLAHFAVLGTSALQLRCSYWGKLYKLEFLRSWKNYLSLARNKLALAILVLNWYWVFCWKL